jgi:hypothetical protein
MYKKSLSLPLWYELAHEALSAWRRPDWRRLTRRACRWAPQLEGLESRLVPTCSPSFISNGVLTLSCDNSGNRIETYVEGRGTEFAEQIFRYWNGSSYSTTGDFYSRFSSIRISAGRPLGSNTITIDDNAAPLLVDGSSNVENVIVGQNGRVFSADITVRNSFGFSSIQVNDTSDTGAMTATLTDTRLTLPGRATISYRPEELRGLSVSFGNAGNTINVLNTPANGRVPLTTSIQPGRLDQVNVLGTSGTLSIGSHVNDSVTIGNGHLDGIRAPVFMSNIYPIGTNTPVTALTVDNQADTGNRTVTLGPTSISFGGPLLVYQSPLTGILLRGGTGTNAYTVTGTPPHQTGNVVLETRGTGDQVHVLANAAPVIIAGSAPNHVEVGNNGRLTNILSDVSVSNARNTTDLVSDDSADPGSATVTITSNTVSYGNPNAVLRYSNLASLTVRTGAGAATANVQSTSAATNVVGGGPLTVNVGNAGTVQGIRAALTVSDPAGRLATVNVNDQNDAADRSTNITLDTVTQGVDFLRLQNLAPATIYAASAQTSALVVNGGSGSSVWAIEATAAGVNTTFNGGAGFNEFAVDASSVLNGADSLLGPLTTHGRPGSNSFLVYYDYLSTGAHTYTLTTNAVSRPGAAPVTFDRLAEVVLYTPRVGGNTINVASVADGVFANLATADRDTVTLGANQTLAAIRGEVAVGHADNTSATVIIDDSADPTPPAGPITLSYNAPNTSVEIGGLVPYGIFLSSAAQNALFTTSLALGAGDKTVSVQSALPGVALTLDASSGTNTLDYTNYPANVLVNLQTGTATGFAGGIANVQNVTGASGGPAGSYNILVGNGGNVLTGGSGRRNLLIAGASASTLIGGNGDDILIGGTTAYDQEADLASLRAIMDYWAGTADDYATRVANLLAGNGVPLLDATTVMNNGGGNTLLGHGGGAGELNLYYGLDPSQENADYDPNLGERFINV